MTGLLLILVSREGTQAETVIEVAATAAALGRPVSVLVKCWPLPDGLQTLADLGTEISVCQTAMAEGGGSAAELPDGVVATGLVSAMAGKEDWQLLLA